MRAKTFLFPLLALLGGCWALLEGPSGSKAMRILKANRSRVEKPTVFPVAVEKEKPAAGPKISGTVRCTLDKAVTLALEGNREFLSRKEDLLLGAMTLGAVVFGITLSTLHQSGLGAMFLLAKNKIHPLWYSEFIPVLFVVSSVFAGLSLVIMEGTITRRVFAHRMDAHHRDGHEGIVLGLSKICAGALLLSAARPL